MPIRIFAMNPKILDSIQKYDSIIIFRHILPDMDALGSQYGLASWIRSAYPQKKVYCAGEGSPLQKKLGLSLETLSEDIYLKSLGIVLDASTANRVDDQNYTRCASTIRIDHHVQTESFCSVEWIDPKASATCEMLALWLKENQEMLPADAANLLYAGLVADNVRFTTKSVSANSFYAAAYLMNFGVDVIACDQMNYSSTWNDYQYETLVRTKASRKNHFLYAVMEQDDYLPVLSSFASAKEKVYVLSGVEDIRIWALFTRMEDGVHYSASLRSKTIDIRAVAQKYHGGGHACACGIKNLTRDQIEEIVELLANLSESVLSISV